MSSTEAVAPPGPTHADALRLAGLGLKAHWLAAPVAGSKSTGKRPVVAGWQNAPFTADPGPPPFPGANVGLRTGRVDGARVCLVTVDLDSPAALAWAREHLPATPWRTITGGGEHWHYRYPEGARKVPNRCRLTLPDGTRVELDVRADGGNVVVAPSVHPSGHVYREAEPWDAVAPEAVPVYDPRWLDGRRVSAARGRYAPGLGASAGGPEPSPGAPAEPPAERPGVQPEQFELRLHAHLQRAHGGAAGLDALRAMRDGKPYARAGERNAALFQAVRLLCEWFPDATDAQLTEFCRASVLATGDKPAEEELANLADVLRRSREKFAEHDAIYLALARAGIEPTAQLTEHGTDLRRRLLVTFPTGGRGVMRPDGSYAPTAYADQALKHHLAQEDVLGWAARAGLAAFTFTDDDGRARTVKWDTVIERYSTLVSDWRGDFNASACHLEQEPGGAFTFVEAVAPRRADLAPRFDARIDAWLRALGGERADLLLDWLASFFRLDRPTPALVLVGAKSSGKNLLAEGLARGWVHGSPTPFEATAAAFNEALQRCPLLFADERLPRDIRGRAELAEHVRALVTARTHELNRKFRPVVTVRGCVRIVVATNDTRFEFGDMNAEAHAALAERLLHIEPGEAARALLQRLQREGLDTAEWVAGDGIVRHVLWLQEHRTVRAGSRLLVDGNGEELINRASNSGGTPADVCQWLCGWLMRPDALNGPARAHVRIEGGELLVSAAAMRGVDQWQVYVHHTRDVPSPTAVGRALAGLSGRSTRRLTVRDGERERADFHRVNAAALFAWAERAGYGDAELMRARLGVAPPPEGGSTPPAPPSAPEGGAPCPSWAEPAQWAALTPHGQGEVARFGEMLARGAAKPAVIARGADMPAALAVLAANDNAAPAPSLEGVETAETPVSEPAAPDPVDAAFARLGARAAAHEGPENDRTEVIGRGNIATVDPKTPVIVPETVDRGASRPQDEPATMVSTEPTAPAPAKRARKATTKVRAPAPPEARAPGYFTPGDDSALGLDEVELTSVDAVIAHFAPRLRAAQAGHPGDYARMTNAYRAAKRVVGAEGLGPVLVAEAARTAWFDEVEAEFIVPSGLAAGEVLQ